MVLATLVLLVPQGISSGVSLLQPWFSSTVGGTPGEGQPGDPAHGGGPGPVLQLPLAWRDPCRHPLRGENTVTPFPPLPHPALELHVLETALRTAHLAPPSPRLMTLAKLWVWAPGGATQSALGVLALCAQSPVLTSVLAHETGWSAFSGSGCRLTPPLCPLPARSREWTQPPVSPAPGPLVSPVWPCRPLGWPRG